ncbi:hypothetical protein Tco_0783479 [Tanacetum coccineum]
MQIPAWMITDEMKQTEHYRMYVEVFRIDVPLTQSQLTESTQGTHRTPNAPRSPNPDKEVAESTRENVALVDEHLASEEIEKMVDEQENIIDDSSIPRNDESNILSTRIEPRSDKEINVNDEDEEITNEVYELKRREKRKNVEETRQNLLTSNATRASFTSYKDVMTLPAMVDKHIKEQVVKQVPEQVWNQVPVYVAKGLILERQKAKKETERLIAKAILQERGNIQAQISTQIENAIANVIPSQVDASVRSYMSGHILHVHPAQSQTSSVPEQQYQLYLAMKADPQLQQQDIAIWLALQMKFERNTVLQTACRTPAVRPRDQDDPHDDAHPKGENSAKRQKTSEYEAYVSGESSSGQVFQEEQALWKKYPEALALSLINQDLLYLKKGNSGPEKIVLSLYKFPAIIFNDDDIEERTSRWIFYIRKQKEPGKPKEEIYSNSKIVQVIKTYWELGHEHKFIIEIVARSANDCIVSITEPDYKNLNKNNIEDIYLLIMNGKVPDYADTGLLWSLSVFIRSTVILKECMTSNLELKAINKRLISLHQ